MNNRFEVSTEGMRSLHAGRKPWQLVKELVSNSWDEKIKTCGVDISHGDVPNEIILTVWDDGPGFKAIEDSWTLMGYTPKRENPMSRGRFNLGEKELISVALSAEIKSNDNKVSFPRTGGRIVEKLDDPINGTRISCVLPWTYEDGQTIIDELRKFIVPKDVYYTVNGWIIPYRKPIKISEAFLDTVLAGPDGLLKNSHRKCNIEIYEVPSGRSARLYEMGIPIQDIGCPYDVNIMQKVPLPPNRDTVKVKYLQAVYAAVLNCMYHKLNEDQASEMWVRLGTEDKDHIKVEAAKKILEKRYGNKVVLWSSNSACNEKAMANGFMVIHGKTLSATEREVFQQAGLCTASTVFPIMFEPSEDVKDPTPKMQKVMEYAKFLGRELIHKDINVRLFDSPGSNHLAEWGSNTMHFNVAKLGKEWFDKITPKVTSVIIHELAHVHGFGHDYAYGEMVDKLSGEAVHLAFTKHEEFAKYIKEN